MNSSRRDRVGERQVSHAEKLHAAGVLSCKGLQKVKRSV